MDLGVGRLAVRRQADTLDQVSLSGVDSRGETEVVEAVGVTEDPEEDKTDHDADGTAAVAANLETRGAQALPRVRRPRAAIDEGIG